MHLGFATVDITNPDFNLKRIHQMYNVLLLKSYQIANREYTFSFEAGKIMFV